MNRFSTIAITAIAGFVLVACGPSASGSTAASHAASQAASQAAQASQGAAGPSFTAGAVADLEALIPSTIGGLTMTKSSSKGNDYLSSSDKTPEMVKFLQDTGVSPSDVSIAIGSGYSADVSSSVFMFVIRAKGADSGRLMSAFKNASNTAGATPVEWASANVGGKSVETAGSNGATTYLYVKGDVLFWITTTTPALANEVIGGLP